MPPTDKNLPPPAAPDEITELTEGLTHEVKNLIASFPLVLEMISRQVDDARLRQLIGRMRGNVDLATSLMDRLAEFGAATPAQGDFVALGLEPLLRDFVLKATATPDTASSLQLRLVSPIPEIFGCPDLILIALTNLVANSRRAAPGQPLEISAETRKEAGQAWVVLAVRDHGPGLTADERAQLDRPYFTTKSAGRGFGLGLPTVRRVMQAHRGALRIESSPGQGTCVNLFFPVSPGFTSSDASR